MSTSRMSQPTCLRTADRPSRRWLGPEKRRRQLGGRARHLCSAEQLRGEGPEAPEEADLQELALASSSPCPCWSP
eukprot:7560340-Alexandrium_andersonii.AAC.1